MRWNGIQPLLTVKPSALLALILIFVPAFSMGCAHGAADVTFRGQAHGQEYYQHFNTAYIASTPAGEYDLVIFNDYLRPRGKVKAGPLEPIKSTPLQQVLHVHIFWQGSRGNAVREQSIANATFDWCIFGSDPNTMGDLIRYEGAGYARVAIPKPGQKTPVHIVLRDGRVHRAALKGDMRDVLGSSTISGDIYAIPDPDRVEQTLKTLDEEIAGKRPATEEYIAP